MTATKIDTRGTACVNQVISTKPYTSDNYVKEF